MMLEESNRSIDGCWCCRRPATTMGLTKEGKTVELCASCHHIGFDKQGVLIDPWFKKGAMAAADLNIPENLLAGLSMWVMYGVSPGTFLSYVILNNARDAIQSADMYSAAAFGNIFIWLIRVAPMGCWGNETNIRGWHNNGLVNITIHPEQ